MKRFKQAIVRPLGTFFLLALFCIFLRCSFHGWLHTIHQKCRPPLPPQQALFLFASFLTPFRLLFTAAVIERLCSPLQ